MSAFKERLRGVGDAFANLGWESPTTVQAGPGGQMQAAVKEVGGSWTRRNASLILASASVFAAVFPTVMAKRRGRLDQKAVRLQVEQMELTNAATQAQLDQVAAAQPHMDQIAASNAQAAQAAAEAAETEARARQAQAQVALLAAARQAEELTARPSDLAYLMHTAGEFPIVSVPDDLSGLVVGAGRPDPRMLEGRVQALPVHVGAGASRSLPRAARTQPRH